MNEFASVLVITAAVMLGWMIMHAPQCTLGEGYAFDLDGLICVAGHR